MSIVAFYTESASDFMHQFAENFETRFYARIGGVINRFEYAEEMTNQFQDEFRSFLEIISTIAHAGLFIGVGSFFATIAFIPISIQLVFFSGAACILSTLVSYRSTDQLEKLHAYLQRIGNNPFANLLNALGGVFDGRVFSRIF